MVRDLLHFDYSVSIVVQDFCTYLYIICIHVNVCVLCACGGGCVRVCGGFYSMHEGCWAVSSTAYYVYMYIQHVRTSLEQ